MRKAICPQIGLFTKWGGILCSLGQMHARGTRAAAPPAWMWGECLAISASTQTHQLLMNYLSNSAGIYIRLRQHPQLNNLPHPCIPREAVTEVKFLYVIAAKAQGPSSFCHCCCARMPDHTQQSTWSVWRIFPVCQPKRVGFTALSPLKALNVFTPKLGHC